MSKIILPKHNEKRKSQKGFTIVELMISTIVFSLVLLAASAAIVQVGKKYYRGLTNARTQSIARSTIEEIAQSLQYSSQRVKVPNYPDNDDIPGPDAEYNIYNLIFASQINGGSEVSISDIDITPSIPDTFYFCIGVKRYSFALNRQIGTTNNPHVFWVDEPTAGCADAVSMEPADLTQPDPSNPSVYPANNGRELLDSNMRITSLSIAPKDNGLWTISLSIASGDGDLMSYTYYTDGTGVPTGEGRVSCEGSRFASEFCAVSEISVNVSKRIQ